MMMVCQVGCHMSFRLKRLLAGLQGEALGPNKHLGRRTWRLAESLHLPAGALAPHRLLRCWWLDLHSEQPLQDNNYLGCLERRKPLICHGGLAKAAHPKPAHPEPALDGLALCTCQIDKLSMPLHDGLLGTGANLAARDFCTPCKHVAVIIGSETHHQKAVAGFGCGVCAPGCRTPQACCWSLGGRAGTGRQPPPGLRLSSRRWPACRASRARTPRCKLPSEQAARSADVELRVWVLLHGRLGACRTDRCQGSSS